jgi:predicted transcriptional regulator
VRTTKLITISLPPELYEKASKLARKEDRTRSSIFRIALQHYITQKEKENQEKAAGEPADTSLLF